MREVLYGVIILNYNTADDCKKAIKSVEDCATTDDYMICVVDGGSSKEGEDKAVTALSENDDHVISLVLKENKGYACGNNEGFKALNKEYDLKYTVIMNPDVVINQQGTIEGIIAGIDDPQIETTADRTGSNELEVVGGQPLVESQDPSKPANEQITIRTAFSYRDFLISNFWVTRRTHKKAFEAMTYTKERPYTDHIKYEVPYGSFFVIRTDIFKEIELFDPDTFLYAEEFILGYKLKQLNKTFMLFPEYMISHFQGKSSGSHGGMSIRTLRNTMDAVSIYMRKYLKVSPLGIRWYRFVCYFNRYTEWIEHMLVRIVKCIRSKNKK